MKEHKTDQLSQQFVLMHTIATDLEGVNGPCPSMPDFTEFLQFPEGAPELFGIVWILIGQVQITLTFSTFTIDYRFVLNKKMFGFHNSNPLLYEKKKSNRNDSHNSFLV